MIAKVNLSTHTIKRIFYLPMNTSFHKCRNMLKIHIKEKKLSSGGKNNFKFVQPPLVLHAKTTHLFTKQDEQQRDFLFVLSTFYSSSALSVRVGMPLLVCVAVSPNYSENSHFFHWLVPLQWGLFSHHQHVLSEEAIEASWVSMDKWGWGWLLETRLPCRDNSSSTSS